MTKFIVGQEVRMSDPYTRRASIGIPAVVTKVGRTVVTAAPLIDGEPSSWQETRFDFDGIEKRSINAAGSPSTLRTLAEVADRCHRQRIIYDLADWHDLVLKGHGRSITTAKLAAILEAADNYDKDN